VPKAVRFISAWDRSQHFEDHGHEFNPVFASAEEYESAAVNFLGVPLVGTMMECLRQDGAIIRYDPTSNELAICDVDGYVRTYFKPDPAIHKLADNITYFRRRCSQ
jgi:filamentous hemagglutinin